MMWEDSSWTGKRRHPRIAWSFVVRFRSNKNKDPQGWEISVIKNISMGGCFFYSNIPFGIGEVLNIEVKFPVLPETMRFTGEVKRCDPHEDDKISIYGVGIQFLEMDADKKDKFINTVNFFLKKHSKTRG